MPLLGNALKALLAVSLSPTCVCSFLLALGQARYGAEMILGFTCIRARNNVLLCKAGFGASEGVEKFMNIKCRISGLKPDCAVIVATGQGPVQRQLCMIHQPVFGSSWLVQDCSPQPLTCALQSSAMLIVA